MTAQKDRTTVALLPHQASILDVAVSVFGNEKSKGEILREAVLVFLAAKRGDSKVAFVEQLEEEQKALATKYKDTIADIPVDEVDTAEAYMNEETL